MVTRRPRNSWRGAAMLALVAAALLGAAPMDRSGHAQADRVLQVAGNALGGSVTVRIIVPSTYTPGGNPTPVAYYLHDARGVGAPDDVSRQSQPVVDALVARGVAVAVTDLEGRCAMCLWIDGLDGVGVDGERHLLEELVPAVESAFNVGGGRGARAVVGTGMGATGASIAALRHPDVFGVLAAVDPVLDLAHPGRLGAHEAYLASQGYPPLAVAEVQHRNVSPLDLAPQAVASNQELLLVSTDGSQDGPAAVLTTLGVPHTYLPVVADDAVWERELAPRVAHALSGVITDPWRFSMKSTDASFGSWGWEFAVERPNVEFLHVAGARLDGRDVILAGTGDVAVTTPAVFAPGRTYVVRHVRDSLPTDPGNDGDAINPPIPTYREIAADSQGRLAVGVELFETRLVDEREAALRAGQHPYHHVRVEIFDDLVSAQLGAWPDTSRATVRPTHGDVATLPEPYASWNVALGVDEHPGRNPTADPQVLELQWDSPAIGRRVSARVWVPDVHLTDPDPTPVLYFTHGTGGGNAVDKQRFHTLLDRMRFVAVAPDSGSTATFCSHCYWIDALPEAPYHARDVYVDGVRRLPVDGETAVLEETIPLVEALFDVRTDRAGRGISGNSMGSLGATNFAFRHPDLFSIVQGLSGQLDIHDFESDPIDSQWWSYLSEQHYPPREVSPVLYRDISPLHRASEMSGVHTEIMWSMGFPCDDTLEEKTYCTPVWDVNDGTWFNAWVNETYGRYHHDVIVPKIVDLGLAFTHPEFTGRHYSPDGDVFEAWMLPRINQTFRDPAPAPDRFSYKSVEREFSVWGYDVTVDRPNSEFLHLLGARTDGRDLIAAGTGTVDLVLPASFEPGVEHTVVLDRATGADEIRTVVADMDGRLHLPDVVLAPARTVDERLEQVEAGAFGFPQVRIRVATTDGTP